MNVIKVINVVNVRFYLINNVYKRVEDPSKLKENNLRDK